MAIVVHPNLAMGRYHEGDDEPPYAWTAGCVRDERCLAPFAAQDAVAYALSTLGLLVTADLEAIRCPTLGRGGNDVLLPPEQARAGHALVARAALACLEDAAHFIPYQRPARFARLVPDLVGRACRRAHDRRRSR